jgi:hypothetical protein
MRQRLKSACTHTEPRTAEPPRNDRGREPLLPILRISVLARLGVRWKRAKRWIESPDPEYARKKGLEIG